MLLEKRDTSNDRQAVGGLLPAGPDIAVSVSGSAHRNAHNENLNRVARVMLYLHPKVARKFKEIGFVENRKAHDVYLDALDFYLNHAGHGGLRKVIEC